MIPRVQLQDCLQSIQVGDCLFFWGKGLLSELIEDFSHGPSHVAMVRKIDDQSGIITVESTQITVPKRFIGVVNLTLKDHLDEYKQNGGVIIWARLNRTLFNAKAQAVWEQEADKHVGDPYSYAQMVTEAYNDFVISHSIPGFDIIAHDFAAGYWHREFCSQYWCILFQACQILSKSRIPGLTSPLNSLQAKIYDSACQIFGDPVTQDFGFNSVPA